MRITWLLLAILPFTVAGQVIYSQNFDGFAVGQKIADSDPEHWRTWSNPPGPTEDAPITDSVSQSMPNSLSFIQTVFADSSAPRDVVLHLGYHLSGRFELRWNMFIHQDGGALITLLHTEDIPSAAPAAIFAFYPAADSTFGIMQVYGNGGVFNGHYPRNAWFMVSLDIDLDASVATLRIDTENVATWGFNSMPSGTPSPSILGAVRFEAYCGSWLCPGRYHIDDVLFQTGTVGIGEVASASVQPLQITPNPSSSATTLSTSAPVHKGTLTIHDASGRIALQGTWPAGSDKYILPTGALAPGTYVVRVAAGAAARDPAGGYVGRLVVMP